MTTLHEETSNAANQPATPTSTSSPSREDDEDKSDADYSEYDAYQVSMFCLWKREHEFIVNLSAAVEAHEAVDRVSHSGLPRRVTIEDKHAQYEQQRVWISGGIFDKSHLRRFDIDKVNKRRRDSGPRVQKPAR